MTSIAIQRPAARDVAGQPRGLVTLAGTELWERISFHGMQALLVLYMAGQLLQPGHVEAIVGFAGFRRGIETLTGPLSVQALASQIFGLYIGLVYLAPVFGGLLGDRVLGRRPTVALGALLMTAGHFCMAFDATFLLALALLLTGAGCLRGNLASQVGALYAHGDRRRADGFQLYFTAINLGAFIAPLVCGLLGQRYGWHVAFGFAGFGMLIGLIVYLAGSEHLPADPVRLRDRPALRPDERRVVVVLLAMLPVATLFWIAQSQIWNVYNLWARDHVEMMVAGWAMPVPWLQAIDGVTAVVLMPPLVWWWWRQAARGTEPDSFTKLGIGCLIFGASVAWLALGQWLAAPRVPLLWAIAFHFLSGVGWLYFTPIIVGLFARAAPAAVNALMIGIYYASVFAGSTISGRLGALYEVIDPARFWLLHGAICAAGGVLFLTLAPWLRREPRRPSGRSC